MSQRETSRKTQSWRIWESIASDLARCSRMLRQTFTFRFMKKREKSNHRRPSANSSIACNCDCKKPRPPEGIRDRIEFCPTLLGAFHFPVITISQNGAQKALLGKTE